MLQFFSNEAQITSHPLLKSPGLIIQLQHISDSYWREMNSPLLPKMPSILAIIIIDLPNRHVLYVVVLHQAKIFQSSSKYRVFHTGYQIEDFVVSHCPPSTSIIRVVCLAFEIPLHSKGNIFIQSWMKEAQLLSG